MTATMCPSSLVRIALLSFLTGLLLTVTPTVFADNATSAAPTAGSGTMIEQPVDTGALIQQHITNLEHLLGRPLPEQRSALVLADEKTAGWNSDVTLYAKKSADYRASCYDSIRRANRDTILKQATTCMRGDLLLHLSFLRKQQAYVASLPAVTHSIQSGATLSIGNLIDAEMTIVNAIDTDLYTSVDSLNDSKTKLMTQYRDPYWLALTKIRADRQLTFIGLMLKRIFDIVQENNTTPLLQKTTLQALSCLQDSTQAYQEVLSATGSVAAGRSLSTAGKTLSDCKDTVWSVGHLQDRLNSQSTESGSLQTQAQK